MKASDAEARDDVPEPTDAGAIPVAEGEEEDDDDVDDDAADAFLCRWPNGDFSIVSASSKRQAILALDEWAGAHPSQVYRFDSFKADFGLTNEGEIVLHEFGEETWNFILDTCYPKLREVLFTDGDFDPSGGERVAEAVEHERKRLRDNQPTDTPKTELGKRIAHQMGTSAPRSPITTWRRPRSAFLNPTREKMGSRTERSTSSGYLAPRRTQRWVVEARHPGADSNLRAKDLGDSQ